MPAHAEMMQMPVGEYAHAAQSHNVSVLCSNFDGITQDIANLSNFDADLASNLYLETSAPNVVHALVTFLCTSQTRQSITHSFTYM